MTNSIEPDIYKAIFDYANKLLLFNFPNEQIILPLKNQIIYRSKIKKSFYKLLEKFKINFKKCNKELFLLGFVCFELD